MKSKILRLGLITIVTTLPHLARAGDFSEALKQSGITGGVVVCLNCGDASEMVAMPLKGNILLHGLETNAKWVAKARVMLRSKKLYGRISVAQYNGKQLPYADNTINLIVTDSLGTVPMAEAMRALAPLGVLMVGGKKIVKPWPDTIDDWPQYLNKADNNAVAMDSVIGPPRRLQWVGDLLWGRSHMTISTMVSMVSGNGRIFSIEDRALTDNTYLPTEFSIVARDAFNGRKLWSREITQWESITMYIKCLPVQQQRRLAVAGDVLYCTFELEGAVSAVDAATGAVLKTYEKTSPCQEVAYDQGILFLNVGERFRSSAYNIVKSRKHPYGESTSGEPFGGSGFKKGYNPEIKDADSPKSTIIAIDSKTGKRLWTTGELNNYTGASLSIKGNYAVYQTADGLTCVNAKTGKRFWNINKSINNQVGHDSNTPGTMPNTVVITDDTVFAIEASKKGLGKKASSKPKNMIVAYALKDGKQLWSAPSQSNFESSSDVFYINGILWVGGGSSPTAYDAKTGKLIREIKQKMRGPMGHDRCYRNLITEKYFINSKTGGADFLNLSNGVEIPNHWARGGCGMGVLPANGLLYSTPFSCTCSVGSMFPGLNAYASVPGLKNSNDPVTIQRTVRLDKGPAYGRVDQTTIATAQDWPMYRYEGSRGGITKTKVNTKLKTHWKAKLPGSPSATTCVGNSVYVCDKETHTLYSINSNTGRINWTFTANARIDSPPTYYKGLLLFGSCDGWMYSVRASDGVMAWRFRDLPDRMIHVRGQLESAWPISGSTLVIGDKLYFAAGRSTYLDGGITLYSLDPITGKRLKSRCVYGPFKSGTGFPIAGKASLPTEGFKNDILVAGGNKLYLHHRAFDLDLEDSTASKPHIMPLSSFLDSHTQHRTGLIVDTKYNFWHKGVMDNLISDGTDCYSVQGFPSFHNHSYFDPRQNSYKLIFGTAKWMFGGPEGINKRRAPDLKKAEWLTNIPITGKALAKAGDIIFVAGEPMKFKNHSFKTYVSAYKGELGGRLLAVSATSGKILAEYKLDAAPVWDSLAIANGRLIISLTDGTVHCFTAKK
jgi:outer membrane protein assembly factor BamB